MATPSDGSHEKAQRTPRQLPCAGLVRQQSMCCRSDRGLPPLSGVHFVPRLGPIAWSTRERPKLGHRGLPVHYTCPRCLTPHPIRVGVLQGLVLQSLRPQPGNAQHEVLAQEQRSPTLGTKASNSRMNEEAGRRKEGIAVGGYIGVPQATDQIILPCQVRSARRVSAAGMGVGGLVGRGSSAVWILFQVGWTRSKK